MRTTHVISKSTFATPPLAVVVAAKTSTLILDDLTKIGYSTIEVAQRKIFNDSGAKLFYSYGTTCDGTKSYHGAIADQGTLDCSDCGNAVYVFSVAGGNVCPTILRNVDLATQRTIIPSTEAII